MRIDRTTIPGRPRFRFGPLTTVWRPRMVITLLVGIAVATALFVMSVGAGDYPLTAAQVIDILFSGHGSELERTIVFEWRLPRAVAAVFVGAALAISGGITQSVTRNSLASPDILGITAGASAMAVTIIILGGGTGIAAAKASGSPALLILTTVGIPMSAFVGALLTATAIWVLASRRKMDTFRLVLAGIIITALLHSYTTWLMLKADIHDAAVATTWLTGSLATTTWRGDIPVIAVMLLCLPLLAAIAFKISVIALGDDTATGLGIQVGRTQVWLLLIAVLLAAVSVSATGPIAFIAFVAPQLALRLAGSAIPPLTLSAVIGMVLLLGADLVTRVLLPVELPVGIITAGFGGMFLLYLLIRVNRRTSS